MERLAVDAASPDEARRMLRTCCGSSKWVEKMVALRPFGTRDAMLRMASETWYALDPEDWLAAFADHPKIGDREALKKRFAETRHLASQEQSGVVGAADDVLKALEEGNTAYQEKFGYIFIVCATGLTAAKMLARLKERLPNDPVTELKIAAEEQAQITAIRLKKL